MSWLNKNSLQFSSSDRSCVPQSRLKSHTSDCGISVPSAQAKQSDSSSHSCVSAKLKQIQLYFSTMGIIYNDRYILMVHIKVLLHKRADNYFIHLCYLLTRHLRTYTCAKPCIVYFNLTQKRIHECNWS